MAPEEHFLEIGRGGQERGACVRMGGRAGEKTRVFVPASGREHVNAHRRVGLTRTALLPPFPPFPPCSRSRSRSQPLLLSHSMSLSLLPSIPRLSLYHPVPTHPPPLSLTCSSYPPSRPSSPSTPTPTGSEISAATSGTGVCARGSVHSARHAPAHAHDASAPESSGSIQWAHPSSGARVLPLSKRGPPSPCVSASRCLRVWRRQCGSPAGVGAR
jgi:hypothetical protein